MGVFTLVEKAGHEQVLFGHDPESGLRTIIAIHSTALGPALGGTRFFPYDTEEQALGDVLRLSRGMTLKAAAAGLDLGGGKAVIIGDPHRDKSERLWRAYGRMVDSFNGRYITAEDVGTTSLDLSIVRRETRWVCGVPIEEGGSGDPSPATAIGLLAALKATADFLWGSEDLIGRRVAVQGVGKVGYYLTGLLRNEGVEVVVADVYQPAIARAVEDFGVKAVGIEEIMTVDCDVFAPCALGAVLNEESIPKLGCEAVAGSANNQLEKDDDALLLAERGILYAPDFLVNAGGLINVFEELIGYSNQRAMHRVAAIGRRTLDVLTAAKEKGILPLDAALQLANERIEAISDLRRLSRGDLARTEVNGT
ncbi:MAG: leucine dehydrogenase [Acidimicrobiia bacterium]|nr:leucine dehydrogenase [Acidimicrobiia bacterium]MDH3396237.1 leucine dehydrogenase [Acidimicrobiia bacterium]MDH5615335.1 leucine dehydrogenase [Acidimicrobiia bacterium]